MKIIQKTREKVIFSCEIEESLANALRRSIDEIPILAVDEVEIHKNDSVLYDEIIAHRLGLVPLKKEKGMNFLKECSCKGKGCAKCSIQLKLVAKGPCTVYASELKGKAKPVYDKTPIVILREGQELELLVTARLGKGINHAKFSPGLVYYRNLAEIKIEGCDACKKCIEACPLSLISVEKKAEVKDIWKCDLCEACVEVCKKHGKNAVSITPSKEIIFFIESFGQIEAKEMLDEAVKVLKGNLKVINKA